MRVLYTWGKKGGKSLKQIVDTQKSSQTSCAAQTITISDNRDHLFQMQEKDFDFILYHIINHNEYP